MMMRVGHAPVADQKYVLRPGAYAILPVSGGVLLTAQIAEEVDIQLPGGGIDPGESPIRALHREVLEETGWRIGNPRRLGAFRRFVYMPEYGILAEKVCHIFVARPIYELGPPSEADHESLVLSADDAVDLLGNDGDRMFVKRYFF
ncbi:NUDIX hydrolase [uncultured Roseobacter sp.]|uniref:NUDIX hydrolase n=1 Tax=uncultured Roseobacter sp. TaxID=114847 RepID=UPI00260FF2C9|nr:NUDIX hydrolase [uncultured Roseobacter sp.]